MQQSSGADRQGGAHYVREWLRVLQARPQYITIADWNNFEEETAIEGSYTWEGGLGFAVPNLYTRITRACSRLRLGALVKGEYYRSQSDAKVYRFDGTRLVYEGATPRRASVNRAAPILAFAASSPGAGSTRRVWPIPTTR